jgi:S1-C subfamily serine protease
MKSHRLHRLVICLIAVIVIIVTAIEAVNTIEVTTELKVIKPLPADWNPYQKLYDELLSPTVRINTKDGIGSGVIIHHKDTKNTKNIYILTANHVVGNNTSVTVTVYSYLPVPLARQTGISNTQTTLCDLCAFVVMTDTTKDLALLCALCDFVVNTAKLAPRNYKPFIFTPVWTVGCSLGLNPRPSSGIITAITHHQDTKNTKNKEKLSDLCAFVVEVSSPILPGNSGGPVYDANTHEIIGIAVWVKTYYGQLITTMAGIVPIQTIYELLDNVQLMNSEEDKSDDINRSTDECLTGQQTASGSDAPTLRRGLRTTKGRYAPKWF